MEIVVLISWFVFSGALFGWLSLIFMMITMKKLDKRITKLEEGNDTLSKE